MTDRRRRHRIVGSEAGEPRPIAYMRSGRRSSTLSPRGVTLLLAVALIAILIAAAALLQR